MNYVNYYGLRRNPFINPKVSDRYITEDVTELTFRLNYLDQVKGLAIIYGNNGSGKTFNIRCFIEELHQPTHKVIYISQTTVGVFEVFKQIAKSLEIPVVCSKSDLFAAIQNKIKYLNTGKQITTVLIIDEANRLNEEVISNLELLLNWDIGASRHCLLILCGTPDLINVIPDSLADRIMVKYNAQGIKQAEIKEYINHMLTKAGCNSKQCEKLFDESAINALIQCCGSNIRKLNMLIDKCLFFGCQKQMETINRELVMLVFNEITIK